MIGSTTNSEPRIVFPKFEHRRRASFLGRHASKPHLSVFEGEFGNVRGQSKFPAANFPAVKCRSQRAAND